MTVDGILFDLDGTLWNSVDSVVQSWNEIIENDEKINVRLTKDMIMSVMGLQLHEIGKKFFPDIEEGKAKDLMKKCVDLEMEYLKEHGGNLYENLEETLKVLSKKHKLCIVSNCQSGYIETFLKAHHMEKYFSDIQDAESTGLTKAENIKAVVKRNHLKNPVYVGDTQKDADSAKMAGIPFIYARYGFGNVEEYDSAIDGLKELLSIIE